MCLKVHHRLKLCSSRNYRTEFIRETQGRIEHQRVNLDSKWKKYGTSFIHKFTYSYCWFCSMNLITMLSRDAKRDTFPEKLFTLRFKWIWLYFSKCYSNCILFWVYI